jgi:hypothetical protein
MICDQSFLQRNEGELIGALGGAFIAILAALLTYLLSKRQVQKKEKRIYHGQLYILHVELYWHKNSLKLLSNSINELKNASMRDREILIENFPLTVDSAVIDASLKNIIEYKNFNHGIVALLVSYQNQLRNIIKALDFKNAKELLENKINEDQIVDSIQEYFDVLNSQYLDKVQLMVPDIRKHIEQELKEYKLEKLILVEE